MAGTSDIKRPLTVEIYRQLDEVQAKVAKITGSLCDLDKNKKRWILIGISLHTIISPVLRKYVAPRLDQLWQTLKNAKKIENQVYRSQLNRHNGTWLNYEAINSNNVHGRKHLNQYNYNVTSPVDLSKLFLQTHMAQYNAFDDTCDSSALLGIIINTGICPKGEDCAKKVRSDVRNFWAHCDFSKWDDINYQVCVKLMDRFIRSLDLTSKEENQVITELYKWNQNGKTFIEGTSPESVCLTEIQKQVQYLVNHVKLLADIPEDIQKIKKELSVVNEMITDHSGRIHQLENVSQKVNKEMEEVKEDIKEAKESIEILNKRREKHKMNIEGWEKEEAMFMVTRATEYVAKLIEKEDVVVVTGSSGSGKSSIIHHVALQLNKKKGYDIIPFISCPADIIQNRDIKKNQVFVVDDICGKNFINKQDLHTWYDKADEIKQLLQPVRTDKQEAKERKHGHMKILVSCRLHIFKDTKFKSLKIFTEHSCDLESKKHQLTHDERLKMIQKYTNLSAYDIWTLDELDKYPYFPLLCKMSKEKTVKEVTEIFKSPIKGIMNDIKIRIETNKIEFCALILCVLFSDGFDETYINPRRIPENMRQKVTDIVTNFKINLGVEMDKKQLRDTYKRLDGTYVKKTGSAYTIAHDKLYDMVAVICGRQLSELFITYSPSSFIAEKFRFKSVFPEQDDSYLYLSKEDEHLYFDRIFKDLKEQDGKSLFYNQQLKEQSYQDKVMRYIEQNKESSKTIFLELDDKCMESVIIHHVFMHSFHYITTPLIEASKIGFCSLVKYLISIECNLNKKDSRRRTSLFYSCINGHLNIVKLLITEGADIQKALYYTCLYGHLNIVKLLITKGGNIQEVMNEHKHLLYHVCWSGHTDIVELLITKGGNIQEVMNEHKDLLYDVCRSGHTNIIKLLITKGADIQKALYYTCRYGYYNIVKLLITKGGNIQEVMNEHKDLLYEVCEEGHTDIICQLITKGADIQKAFYYSCHYGRLNIVKLLITKGGYMQEVMNEHKYFLCDVCEESYSDIIELLITNCADIQKALYYTCHYGYLNFVDLLITKGGNIQEVMNEHKYLLYDMCEGGHTDIVELLITNCADIQEALYYTCRYGYLNFVDLLITKGGNIQELMNEHKYLLYEVCRRGHIDIVELLITNCADIQKALYCTCLYGYLNFVNLLITKGGNIQKVMNEYTDLLCDVCKEGHTDIIELLITNCADIQKSLYYTCRYGYLNFVNLLITKGGNIQEVMNEHKDLLYEVCEEGHTDIICQLITKGADIQKALYYTCLYGHLNIVKLLIIKGGNIQEVMNEHKDLLCHVCWSGHTDIIELLITKGADIQKALYYACLYGHLNIVKLLIIKGGNIQEVMNEHKDLLCHVCWSGHTDIIELFITNCADIQKALYYACLYGHLNIVKLLIIKGGNIQEVMNENKDLLYHVCRRGYTDIIELLITNCADIQKALYYTCRYGYLNFVNLLKTKGGNIQEVMNEHKDLLYEVCEEGHTDIICQLITKGADIQKALYYTCLYGHLNIVKLLINKGGNIQEVMNEHKDLLHYVHNEGHTDIVQLLLDRNADPTQVLGSNTFRSNIQ